MDDAEKLIRESQLRRNSMNAIEWTCWWRQDILVADELRKAQEMMAKMEKFIEERKDLI